MYEGVVAGGVSVVAGGIAVAVLPNTGSGDNFVALAIAVLVGLVTWGTLYAKFNR